MWHQVEIPDDYIVPRDRFDNADLIQARIGTVPPKAQGSLRTALRYLYKSDGPTNLPLDRKNSAMPFLEPGEKVLVRWLSTRTNGSERANYGKEALKAARASRYRCAVCEMPDVRVLQLDHVDGRKVNAPSFRCLCANCHQAKSRTSDWSPPQQ